MSAFLKECATVNLSYERGVSCSLCTASLVYSVCGSQCAGRVRFAEGTQLEPEGVRVEPNNSRYQLPEAHLGILRNHHTYHAGERVSSASYCLVVVGPTLQILPSCKMSILLSQFKYYSHTGYSLTRVWPSCPAKVCMCQGGPKS